MMSSATDDPSSWRGAAAYTPLALRLYDRFVLDFSSYFAWRCPSRRILALYRQNQSDNIHVDIGPGSGYFLAESGPSYQTILVDYNINSLAATAKRLRRKQSALTLLHRNILDVQDYLPCYSVGISYVLHCLPGVSLLDKQVVLQNAASWLGPEGVLFGSTILGDGVSHTALGRLLIRVYNAWGIFSNRGDRQADLSAILDELFIEHTIEIVGSVALFVARNPKRFLDAKTLRVARS